MRYTRLPTNINKVRENHIGAVYKVAKWFDKIGCKTSFSFWCKTDMDLLERVGLITNFDIEVSHSNDYIECGPHDEDPTGEMFYIRTFFGIEINPKPEDLDWVIKSLEAFDWLVEGSKRPKGMGNIHLKDFDRWNIKITRDRLSEKLKISLKFSVDHSWGSKYNKKGE